MKECNDCKETKPLGEFNWRNKSKGTKQPYCIPCQRATNRKDYKENKHRWKGRAAQRKVDARKVVLEYLNDNHCVDCGENRKACLQFDHKDGVDKDSTLSRAVNNGWSKKRLMDEIKKCDVRCANCHAIRTSKQFGWYSNIIK